MDSTFFNYGMPQINEHYNIIDIQTSFMSTIIIQKQDERNLKQNVLVKKHENVIQTQSLYKWTEIAGLSWVLLEREDEY